MKLIAITGSHLRHLYVLDKLVKANLVDGIVLMRREEMIVKPPSTLSGHMREVFVHHFALRDKMEKKYFCGGDIEKIIKETPTIEIQREELNDTIVENFIKECGGDCIFTYGPDLLKDNILNLVNNFAINLHGGLSPWYKGAATMFWPFYFLEPNFVGTTLHYITQKIDAGNIIHHTVPKLDYGDCMHAVACKAIVAAADDAVKIVKNMKKGVHYPGVAQRKNGKLFLDKDWRPEHLRLIYDLYEDKIVDLFLDHQLSVGNEPELIRTI